MKKILGTALTVSAVLALAPVPASAETDLAKIVEEVTELAGPEVVKLVKERGSLTKQMEHDLSKLPVGSSEWWQQYERERGGRGRR